MRGEVIGWQAGRVAKPHIPENVTEHLPINRLWIIEVEVRPLFR